NFIPLLGQVVLGVVMACIMLFMNCALFFSLPGREGLCVSYPASFHLIKTRIFENGAAVYVVQMMVQFVMGLIVLIPLAVIGIIAFNTVGFTNQFFDSFTGKFLVSIGSSIFMLFLIFFSIYLVAFYVLQYFSL